MFPTRKAVQCAVVATSFAKIIKKRGVLPLKMQNLQISNIEVVPCTNSNFVKTSRVKFMQVQ